ncbi:hypothetical protein TPHA_0O01150 [Tetrapisispora phaffii CBS 4417]|uniref:Uncharacterized protein n=1 Tax=Tetrapisispora phaffii (strain ATCC 24235 / CBS 4417 / NBRC 1672 / NRRL Y-8282 / UCD 70-5) TaxID=1071381 RepID=G8C1Q6_TETPH|nr:hypothetical protein TPHA_0O01150 [Tetrapisispora phaffii CBS 4417]CCE66084.1 hypothetical protein TPHA_0O01150 [Tetrapisispora phaffii CBS 4417]
MSELNLAGSPSLIGESIRSVEDSNNPDYNTAVDASSQINKITGSTLIKQLNKHSNDGLTTKDTSYTSVEDLNREGALLTDEMDMDRIVNVTSELKIDDKEDDEKRLALLKKKKELRERMYGENSKISNNGSSPYLSMSPSLSNANSLVTSTDPIDDQMNTIINDAKHSNIKKSESESESESEKTIRNSYGEFIKKETNKPHLARGDSYQSSVIQEESNGQESKSPERLGRTFNRYSSTEYLRSLSNSLSRDVKNTRSSFSESSSTSDPRLFSTNNYSISQMDLQNAPHIIKEEELEAGDIQARHL